MGLLCEFTAEEMGWPLELEEEASDGTIVSVLVDYSAAFQEFVDVFLSTSRNLVPVDTGYLQSTLEASCTDESAEANTICEYAQYVEYGTWCQSAQPYFEPAIMNAYDAFVELALLALEDAEEKLADELEAIEEEIAEEEAERAGAAGVYAHQMGIGPGAMMGGRYGGLAGALGGGIMDWGFGAGSALAGDGVGGIMAGAGIGALGLVAFFPVALFLYGLQQELGIITGSTYVGPSGRGGGSYGGRDGYGGGDGYPEIIIT